MEFTAKQIAEFVQGRVEGNENAAINTFAKIEEGHEGAISFLSNPKYTHYLYDTKSTIVLINEDVVLEQPVSATLIRVKNAYECVAKLLQLYESMKPYVGDNVKIGDGSRIYPHVTIYEGCRIGKNVTIHAGSVIGADGFGFAPIKMVTRKSHRLVSLSLKTMWKSALILALTVQRWDRPLFTKA